MYSDHLINDRTRSDLNYLYSDGVLSVGSHYISHIMFYKWKNHFSEMKGDVGMSLHEKEGEQEDA